MQVVHAENVDGARRLVEELTKRFKCAWLPMEKLSLVLGAHVGRSMIGVAFAPEDVFELK